MIELMCEGDCGDIESAIQHIDGTFHELRVLLIEEDDREFSILSLNLPGVASQGATREEAISNIVKAFEEIKSAYIEDGIAIPWTSENLFSDDEFKGTEIRILVNA